MRLPTILIVEDEHALALALAAAVRQAGAQGELAPTATQARQYLASNKPVDAMVLDIGLPDQNGLEFLESLEASKRPPTVIITAHGEIENNIAARKLGVVDFLTKPLDFAGFQATLKRVLPARRSGRKSNRDDARSSVAFVGAAPSMRPVFQQIAHSCASDAPVLVRGDTGTGKSHAASLIQLNSNRTGPASTLTSSPNTTCEELSTALEDSAEGVLVIEEIALLHADVQAELVRHMESGPPEQLSRLIVTSSDDLRERVSEESFRSDLFYRLQVLEVRLPPLKERMEDLPALVSYFVGQLSPDRVLDVSDTALQHLSSHNWPGNLRELRNAVAYALTMSTGATALDADDFPPYLNQSGIAPNEESPDLLAQAIDQWLDQRFAGEEPPLYRDLAETLEATMIRQILERYDGKLARMANALQANRTTLRKRLQEGER